MLKARPAAGFKPADSAYSGVQTGSLTTDVNALFHKFSGDAGADEVYDKREVDGSIETVRQWVLLKEEAWRKELACLNAALNAERITKEKFQFLAEDTSASLSAVSQENTRLKCDLAALNRELQFLKDEKKLVCHQLEVDQKQVDDSKKDKETLAKILEDKQAAEESARKAIQSELASARAQLEATQAALKEAQVERDHHWRSIVELKRKHKAKRKALEEESSRLLRCLETQTKVTSSHLAAISQQLAPGGSLRQSLDAGRAQGGLTAAYDARSMVSWHAGGRGGSSVGGSDVSSPRSAADSSQRLPAHQPSALLLSRHSVMRESSPMALMAAAAAIRAASGPPASDAMATPPAAHDLEPPPPRTTQSASPGCALSAQMARATRASGQPGAVAGDTEVPLACVSSVSPQFKGSKRVSGEGAALRQGRLLHMAMASASLAGGPCGKFSRDGAESYGKENKAGDDLSLSAFVTSQSFSRNLDAAV